MTSKGYTAFARLLKNQRTNRQMSRRQVAAKVGITPEFIGRIERAEAMPSMPTFARLRDILGFDANKALEALDVTVGETTKRERKASTTLIVDKEGQYVTFGRRLADARNDALLTQTAVADAIRVHRRHVARLERGHEMTSVVRFARLHRLLGFDADLLLAQLTAPETRTPFHGFGGLIQVARVAGAMTAAEVAQRAGCDVAEYQRIERGEVLPGFLLAVRIHRITHYDVNKAFRWLWQTGALPHP